MHNAFITAEFFASPTTTCRYMQSYHRLWISAKSAVRHCRQIVSLFLFFAAAFSFTVAMPSDQSIKARTKRAYMEGDIMIGVLMPMHKQSDKKNDYRQACGVIWEGYGIHRLEQFFRAIDEINSRSDILPGIKLGYDVRDSCWTIPVALEQSIDFIRNKIGTLDKQMAGGAAAVEASSSGQVTSSTKGVDCSPQQRGKTIAALIGPGSSTISGPIQNVLQLFEIPEIDFGATAVELSDKNKHRFFSRVVPSDKQQARVLVDIILRHNWTYIHAVHTEGMYGENGMEEFKAMLSKTGACIAVDKKLKSNVPTSDVQYMELLNEIRSKGKDKAKVIVCFCDGLAVRGIFNATATYRRVHPDYDGKFLVIGSDGWNVREDVVKNLESTANGGISIKLHSPKIEDFEVYLSKLNPLKNERNPWYQEFWEWKFNCTFDRSLYGWRKPCDPSNPEQRIKPDSVEQDAKLGFVVNAVFALAHAFHSMLTALCPRRNDFSGCPHINQTINGTMVFSYLRNVTFISYSNDSIKFDEYMDGVGRYEIMNYRFNESVTSPQGKQGVYEYQKIGWWDSGNLWLKDLIEWPNVTDDIDRNIESVCSRPCEKGKVKKIQEGGVPCCWSCQQCEDNQYIISDSQCMSCQPGWWPDENLTSCLPLEIKYKSLMDKDSLICVGFASFGVLSCAFVLIIFARHHSTPVVKASTRELTYIILAGVFLSYLTTVPLLMKPTLVSCYFTRILPGFSFSLIYGALATKTNRIARILSGSKKKIITRKPRFLSASAQVVITCIIVGVECVIITLMLILEPADSILDYPSKREVRLKCNTTDYGLMIPFGFDMFLIAMCTLYAVRTRNMPENFNEAKFIGFCMYTTCAIWASFVPIYFNSESRMTTMSFCISASATSALIFLFYPKIYIMVYQPEKNTKSAFSHAAESNRSRLDSIGSASEATSVIQQRRPPPDTVIDLKRRLSSVQRIGSSIRTASEIEEILKDKLEGIIPAQPAKMPKPKTISELMHQRRMSVASAGSTERLLAAALRHTRGSVVPAMMAGNASICGSQEVLTKASAFVAEPAPTEHVSDQDEESVGSIQMRARTASSGKTGGTRSRSQSESSAHSADSAYSNNSNRVNKSQDSSQPAKGEKEGSQECVAGQTDTSSTKSADVAPASPGIPSLHIDSVASSPAEQRLTLPSGPVALLLPRPSPIPEEDEENADNTSSQKTSTSPHTQEKLRRGSSKQTASLQKQHSASSGSSAATSKAAAVAQQGKTTSESGPPPKKTSSSNNDNGAMTYVNLDAIQHHKQTPADVPLTSVAPPLPPKPAKLLSSTPSALADRLIDHLYATSRYTEKLEKQRITPKPASPKKTDQHRSRKIMQPYVIPEGPPRPISPTEFEEKRRRKGKSSGKSLQQMLASSRIMIPLSMDIRKVLKKQLVLSPTVGDVSTDTAESSTESSTNAEAAEPSHQKAAMKFAGKKTSSSTRPATPAQRLIDARSLLISPMSSTSYDCGVVCQPKQPKQQQHNSSSSEDSSLSRIPLVILPGTALASATNDSAAYYENESDSTTASTPSTAVALRIATAEHQHTAPATRQFYQPTKWIVGSATGQASMPNQQPHRQHQQLRGQAAMTPGSSERADDGAVIAGSRPAIASSISSSGLSEDTLADLPSIEELSVSQMQLLDEEEADAVRFKDFMNNLGVDIDISVFQSTEV